MYKLDLRDRKILSEIELDARVSNSELGKRLGVSKQVIDYRLKKLENAEIIQNYHAIIDLSKLNKSISAINLKFINVTSSEIEALIQEISLHPKVLASAKCEGIFDLTFGLISDNNRELNQMINDLTKDKSDKIKEKIITTEIEGTYLNKKLLFDTKKDIEIKETDIRLNISISDDEKIIIEELAKNARISLVELANITNLSPNGVKNKIKKLEKEKIILGYQTKINFEKLGYLHFRVFLKVKDFSQDLFDEFKKYLKSKGNVESINIFIGFEDFNFRCYVEDIHEFHKFITELKDEFHNVIIEINSIIIFEWKIINYSP